MRRFRSMKSFNMKEFVDEQRAGMYTFKTDVKLGPTLHCNICPATAPCVVLFEKTGRSWQLARHEASKTHERAHLAVGRELVPIPPGTLCDGIIMSDRRARLVEASKVGPIWDNLEWLQASRLEHLICSALVCFALCFVSGRVPVHCFRYHIFYL